MIPRLIAEMHTIERWISEISGVSMVALFALAPLHTTDGWSMIHRSRVGRVMAGRDGVNLLATLAK